MRLREGCAGGGKGPLIQNEMSGTLATHNDQYLFSPCLTPWDTQQSRIIPENGLAPTLAGADGGGGRNPGGLVFAAFMGDSSPSSFGVEYMEEGAPTLKPRLSGTPCVCEPKVAAFVGSAGAKARSIGYSEKVSPTLKGEPCGFVAPCVCEPKLARTLTARGDGSPNVDSGPNIVALGVSQNQYGDLHVADTAYALTTNGNATGRNAPLVCSNIHAFSLDSAESNSMKSDNPHSGCREVETARTIDTTNPCPSKNQGGIAVVEVHPKISGTLCASGAGLSRPAGMASETDLCVVIPGAEPIPINDRATRYKGGGDTRKGDGSGNGLGVGKPGDPAPTMTACDRHAVAAYCLQGTIIGRQDHNGPRGIGVSEEICYTLTATDTPGVASVDCRNYRETEELSATLQAKENGSYSLNFMNPVRMGYIVRRLLPVECERLQGYPDGWTEFGHDGKPIADTRRYMMLGNSVAVPCVAYILMGIAEQLRRPEPSAPAHGETPADWKEAA